MSFRLTGLQLRYDRDDPETLASVIAGRLGISTADLCSLTVVRRSIDARRKPVTIVYTADVETRIPLVDVPRASSRATLELSTGTTPSLGPVVIVGAGPAGLVAAMLLSQYGYAPLILERGGDVASRNDALSAFAQHRTPDPECNALFGLGGAGTFSDGKLTTSLHHPLIDVVVDMLLDCGAPVTIGTDAKPHIGTDRLQGVVTTLAERIVASGGQIRTGVRVTGLRKKGDRVVGVNTSEGPVEAGHVLLAIGHSARDTLERLSRGGVPMAPKPFQMGVRVEHPQSWLDRQQYGDAAGHPSLGAADYKVSARVDGVPVFSFCMCPGGWTMPTVNEPGHLCVNGMSRHAREGQFASSGLVVTLDPSKLGLLGIEDCLSFVRGVERSCFAHGGGDYGAPAQTIPALMAGNRDRRLPETGYPMGVVPVAFARDGVLPSVILDPLRQAIPQFQRRLPGFVQDRAVLIAPEARASSAIRILRDPTTRQSTGVRGLYPVGEGAGYAGGIMSAALDGLRSAVSLMETFAPMKGGGQ